MTVRSAFEHHSQTKGKFKMSDVFGGGAGGGEIGEVEFHNEWSIRGNPKTLIPGPQTPTTDRVCGLPTDRSTDYPYGPPAK